MRQNLTVLRTLPLVPIQLALFKSAQAARIWYKLAGLWFAKLRKFGELFATTSSNKWRQLGTDITKIAKCSFASPLFSHKQHRYGRGKQINCAYRHQSIEISQTSNTVAKSAVADLVVILNE